MTIFQKLIPFFSALCVFFSFIDKVCADETQLSLIKSYKGRHIVEVPKSDFFVDQNVIVSNDESVSVTYKITRVNRSKTKILLEGPEYINLGELCEKNCKINSDGGSLVDEFSVGSNSRKPTSE